MKLLLATLSVILASGFSVPAENEYKIVKQDKTVTLYERWIQQGSAEKVREMKAVFDVRASAVQLVKLLQNQQLGTKWNPHAKDYRISPATQPNQWINYVKYSMPWPFDDQECCMLFSQDHSSQVSFNSTYTNSYPIRKNISRINMVTGKWVMQDKGNGMLNITYIVSTAKSKNIPAWVSDPIVRNNMMETMKSFKKILENE